LAILLLKRKNDEVAAERDNANNTTKTEAKNSLSALIGKRKADENDTKNETKSETKKDAKLSLAAMLLNKKKEATSNNTDTSTNATNTTNASAIITTTTEPKQSLSEPPTSLAAAADKFSKYSKMKKIGMPEDSIKNRMKMDGFKDDDIAKFFGTGGDTAPANKEPTVDLTKFDLSKYDKMKKLGLPPDSVRSKMKMDAIQPNVIAAYFGDTSSNTNEVVEEKPMEPPTPKPDFGKYERMQKIGLPAVSIKNKMKQDSIHEYWICVFF